MTPERFIRLKHALESRQPDLTVVTDSVHKERNLSAIIRNCEAVGIHEVHCVTDSGNYRPFRGTARGAWRWVNLNVYTDIANPLEKLKSRNVQIIAAHLDDNAVNYREIDYTQPTALVMGNEKDGISEQCADYIDTNIVIPMRGMVESFNVSVASGIILAEAQRQRELAGMYDTCRLSEAEYKRTFFEWAHPQLTRFCQDKAIPYPPLDDSGEVIDGAQWYAKVRKLT